MTTVPVYCHMDIRKLLFHLERFVTYHLYGRIRSGKYKAFGFAFVAAAQYGYFVIFLQ